MTLGTNANLEELIKYSPQEIDFDFILEELKELEEWRELLDQFEYCAADVKERIDALDVEANTKGCEIYDLKVKVDELSEEINFLNNRIEELESTLEEKEGN